MQYSVTLYYSCATAIMSNKAVRKPPKRVTAGVTVKTHEIINNIVKSK